MSLGRATEKQGTVPSFLRRYRRRVRAVRALCGLGVTLLAATALLGAAVALDRSFLLGAPARLAITAAAALGTALAAVLGIAVPLLRPISTRRAALGIEAALPRLEEGLLTSVELAEGDAAAGASLELIEAMERSVAARLGEQDPARLADARPVRWLGAAGAALLVLLAFAALDFRAFGLLFDRFLHPTLELPRPSRVGLVALPGNAAVGIDDDLEVAVQVLRGSPGSVALRHRVPGGEWKAVRLGPSASGSRHTFRRVRQSFEYQALAGDAATAVHRVEARERPRAESFTITLHFPAYTRRPPATATSPRGDLAAVAGTRAEVAAACAGRPVRALLLGADGIPSPADPLPIEVGPDGRAVARAEVAVERSGSYRIQLEDADGISNRGGDIYAVHAEGDRPPRPRLLSPRAAEVPVEDSARLELRYAVEDDFGVEALWIEAGAASAGPASPPARRFPVPLDERAGAPRAAGSYPWELLALELRPGETLPFRLVARDGLGQEGSSPEVLLRVPFLPDPPEGAGWLPGLRELDRALERAADSFRSAIDGHRAGEGAAYAIDLARAERLSRSSEEVLRTLARLRQLAEAAAALGRAIPIPSVNRAALGDLGAELRRIADGEGRTLWLECVALAGEIREALRPGRPGAAGGPSGEVDASALRAAFESGTKAIEDAALRLRALHRAERLEGALERTRALLQEEDEMSRRLPDLAAPGAEALFAAAAKVQGSLRVEGTKLGAELAEIVKLGDPPGSALGHFARGYIESAIPAFDAAQQAADARDAVALAPALGSVTRLFRDFEESLAREASRAEEAARAARKALAPRREIPRRLEALAADEAARARALEERGLEAVAEAAAGDAARQPGLQLLRDAIGAAALEVERREPADFESAGDLAALRDLFQELLGGVLEDAARRTEELKLALAGPAPGVRPSLQALRPLILERRRAAEALSGLARAFAGVEPGAELGARARELEAIAEAEEAAAWKLRNASPDHARSLRALAGVGRELALALSETLSDLEAARDGIALGTPAAGPLGEAAALTSGALEAAAEAAQASSARDPARALASASRAARTLGEAARRTDEARVQLPALLRARAWIQRELGSLPQRIERLAREVRGHVEAIGGLADQLAPAGAPGPEGSAPPLEEEQVASAGIEAEALREEAARLAAGLAREASRSSLGPPQGGAAARAWTHALDLAADRIAGASEVEMLRAAKLLEEASRASGASPQLKLLRDAASLERRAAEELFAVARALRLLEERDAARLAERALEKLLGAPEAPAAERAVDAERVRKEAQLLLEGVARAAETLAARLPEGVLKAEVLDQLGKAAERFRAAVEAASAGDGAGAAALVVEGRDHVQAAIALARRLRGEAETALAEAQAEEEGKKREAKPRSREVEEVYAELERIQALRDRQADIEAELDELLKEPSKGGGAEKLKELAKLEQALAEELGARFLTTAQLVELVADLLSAGREAARIALAQRGLRDEAEKAAAEPERAAALAPREEEELEAALAMGKQVHSAGAVLTINLPAVLKPFWEAESRLQPSLAAMRAAREALAAARPVPAAEELKRAASGLSALSELLGIARARALEEIAEREARGGPGAQFGEIPPEEAAEALRDAARELARGRPESAQSLQGSAQRSLTSAAEALRARLDRARLGPLAASGLLPGAAGAGVPGLTWEVLLRGDEPPPGGGEGRNSKPLDPFDRAAESLLEEYRELVRIYLRALAGGR